MNEQQRTAALTYQHAAWCLLAALNQLTRREYCNTEYLLQTQADVERAAGEWARVNRAEDAA